MHMHKLKTSFRTMLIIGITLGFLVGSFASAWKVGTDSGGQVWGWLNNNDGYITTSGGKGFPATTTGLQSAVTSLATTGGTVYGNSATITLTTYINISDSNIEVRDLHIRGADGIKVYVDSGTVVSNVTLRNIDLHITSGSLESAIVVYVEGTATARNILIDNCFANDCYSGGIYFDGLKPSKLINATIRDSKAYHCGHTGYTDGMFLGTYDNSNVLYENCLTVENWDLGFSNEFDHIHRNVKYLSCGAIKNGLKRNFAGNGTNCSGFIVGHGVELIDCYTDSNWNYGFLLGSDANNMNITTVKDCRDNHSRVSLYVARSYNNPDGGVIVDGFTSVNSTDEAIRIVGSHITAKNMVVINPGYNHSYGGTNNGIRGAVMLGGVLDRIMDSEIEVSIYNLTDNSGSDYVFGGLYGVIASEPFRCTISANVKGSFTYPIYSLSPTDTVFTNCYVDSHCRAGLRTTGTVTNTFLKDSFICDNYGGSISTAGVWGNGTVGNLKVETGSVTIMDATTPMLGCNAVSSAGPFIWNSKGNGFNVSQSGLQQAIWDLNSSGGGWVELPTGTITITKPIINGTADNIEIILSKGTTLKLGNTANCNMFQIYNRKGWSIHGGTLNGNRLGQTSSGGAAASSSIGIELWDVQNFSISDMTIMNFCKYGIRTEGAGVTSSSYSKDINIHDNIVTNNSWCNIIADSYSKNILITNNICSFGGDAGIGCGSGGHIYNITISNNIVHDCNDVGAFGSVSYGVGISVESGLFHKVIGNTVYSCKRGIGMSNAVNSGYSIISGNTVRGMSGSSNIWVNNNYCSITDNIINVSTASNWGIYNGDGTPSHGYRTIISGNIITGVINAHGIILSSTNNCSIIDNIIFITGTGNSIRLADNADYNIISNNRATGSIGININNALCNNNIVTGNNLFGATTKITNTGTSTIIRNNLGYVTENWGNATIGTTVNSIIVSHNMSEKPICIMVTPYTNISCAGTGGQNFYWVDTFTTTTFILHLMYKPTATAKFNWYAKV